MKKDDHIVEIFGVRFVVQHWHEHKFRLDLISIEAFDKASGAVAFQPDVDAAWQSVPFQAWWQNVMAHVHHEGHAMVMHFPHKGIATVKGWLPRKRRWEKNFLLRIDPDPEGNSFIPGIDKGEPMSVFVANKIVEQRKRLARGEEIVF